MKHPFISHHSGAIQINFEPERNSQNLKKNQCIFKGYPS
jgi:hypothetical protein